MAIKKRTTLRDKSAKANSKASLNSKISELKQLNNDEDYHENPLLKLSKTTKKEKQLSKSNNFAQKLLGKVTFNTSSGISKSSLRRRKRKEKEQLKPKMDELLLSLPEETTNIVNSSAVKTYIKASTLNSNQPNAAKISGHQQILKQENKNFHNVLKNPEFRSSPFSALKNAIQQNLQK